jgi:dolichol-phosphate mannosyltransferase
VVSVVVPTRNEAGNIGPLGDRLRAALGDVPYEICFVDDSDDETPERIADLESTTGSVRYLFRQGDDREGGLSTAVVAGLHMARGRWVCVMDADLQHPPELIPRLLAEGEAGADLVVASRYATGGSREGLDGAVRRFVSRGATAAARLLFVEARLSTDPLSGFFLCRRSIIDGIEFRPVGFKILLELLVCVPGLHVVDVPLTQAQRGAGASKASMGQGLLYLGHLLSLFLDVPGSARRWKFALVGLSGLAVFLPLLWALAGPAGLHPLVAFVPAFALSVVWNGLLNWVWTYADQRRGGGVGLRRYLDWALISGGIMFGVFALLVEGVHLAVLASGAVAAVLAMAVNGLVNRSVVARRPSVWASVAVDHGVQASLARLAADVGADRAYVLPPRADASAALPPGLLVYAISRRHPMVITEAASHRVQRRTNIEVASRMILPVVDRRGGLAGVVAVVVCERYATRGFDATALETATRAVAELVPVLAAARVEMPIRAEPQMARSAPGTS